MNNVRYFKIEKQTSITGVIIFKVFSTDNWFCKFFNVWDEYQKDNYTLKQSLLQIDTIMNYKKEKTEIVYSKSLKN